jgi:hypothetical protein
MPPFFPIVCVQSLPLTGQLEMAMEVDSPGNPRNSQARIDNHRAFVNAQSALVNPAKSALLIAAR